LANQLISLNEKEVQRAEIEELKRQLKHAQKESEALLDKLRSLEKQPLSVMRRATAGGNWQGQLNGASASEDLCGDTSCMMVAQLNSNGQATRSKGDEDITGVDALHGKQLSLLDMYV
jgi:hypothetical protein